MGEQTLCWNCRKSCGNSDCPWFKNFTAVEGWDAIPTKIYQKGGQGRYTKTIEQDSFLVRSCPLFEEEISNEIKLLVGNRFLKLMDYMELLPIEDQQFIKILCDKGLEKGLQSLNTDKKEFVNFVASRYTRVKRIAREYSYSRKSVGKINHGI